MSVRNNSTSEDHQETSIRSSENETTYKQYFILFYVSPNFPKDVPNNIIGKNLVQIESLE
jgi:hypothetical protein